jgi:flavin reductase (DIM6/NTAB) family NADH-FMN oxidoreductase RutF
VEKNILENGKINPKKLKPVGRLGGNDYTTLGDIITVKK